MFSFDTLLVCACVYDVSKDAEARLTTAAKYSGSCSGDCVSGVSRKKLGWILTGMLLSKMKKSLFEIRKNLVKGSNGVLLGRMSRAQVDGFSGSL